MKTEPSLSQEIVSDQHSVVMLLLHWMNEKEGSMSVKIHNYTVSQKKCTKFETVQLKIIRTDFDDIWQKYSEYSRIEFAWFSFPVGLHFYQLFVFQTGHRK